MKTKLAGKVVAGFLGSMLIGQAAHAQMQTGSGAGGSSAGGRGGQIGSSTPLGGTNGAGSMTLQGMDFSQGATSTGGTTTGTGPATTSRTQRRTGSRTGATAGSMGLTGLSGSLNGGGRGGTSSTQSNRQTERHAQYSIRMELNPTLSASNGGTGSANGQPGSTIQVRNAVERSVASVVSTGANVTMDGSNAIISGMVGSEHDRKLVERMVLLVPGVDTVRNELVVQANSTKL